MTGRIGEARILFVDTEDVKAGARATMTVAAGKSLGLFLIPDIEELGIELEDFEDGGLFFRNFTAGDVADLYDGDDATTYTPGPASIFDGIAPVVTDDEGNLLPIRAFHSVGNRDGFNFLNPVAGQNARAFADGTKGVDVVAFEDGLASLPGADDDEGGYDGDFNDAFVAVSDDRLSRNEVSALVAKTGISRLVGTDGADKQTGTGKDDQLIALDGNDKIRGRGGDDLIEASDGNDRAYGGAGDDRIFGEEGRDRLFGGTGRDEIEGGEGGDRICGGAGRDDIEGDEGNDRLYGGGGFDEIEGGEGRDRLYAGRGGAELSGGADDDSLFGYAGAADVFKFDLIPFGRRPDRRVRERPRSHRDRRIPGGRGLRRYRGVAARIRNPAQLRRGQGRSRRIRREADRRLRLSFPLGRGPGRKATRRPPLPLQRSMRPEYKGTASRAPDVVST